MNKSFLLIIFSKLDEETFKVYPYVDSFIEYDEDVFKECFNIMQDDPSSLSDLLEMDEDDFFTDEQLKFKKDLEKAYFGMSL